MRVFGTRKWSIVNEGLCGGQRTGFNSNWNRKTDSRLLYTHYFFCTYTGAGSYKSLKWELQKFDVLLSKEMNVLFFWPLLTFWTVTKHAKTTSLPKEHDVTTLLLKVIIVPRFYLFIYLFFTSRLRKTCKKNWTRGFFGCSLPLLYSWKFLPNSARSHALISYFEVTWHLTLRLFPAKTS